MDNHNGMVCDSVNTIINQPVTTMTWGILGSFYIIRSLNW